MHRAAQLLAHPLPLVAAAVLALNDHVLKGSAMLPGALTGKLSDVAGLFVFVVLLCGVLGAVRPRGALAVAFATGAAFAAINLSPLPAVVLAPVCYITPDPTDLVTLPSALVGAWFAVRGARRPRKDTRLALQWALVAAVAVACMATSPPRLAHPYPWWSVADHVAHERVHTVTLPDGERAQVWVSKSGKEGLGLSITAPTEFKVTSATLTTADGTVSGGLTHATGPDAYIPFAFDNDRLWKRGEDLASVKLELQTPGGSIPVELPLVQAVSAPERRR